MALLDQEKYIEDDYIDSSYFGGLKQGQGLFTYYFQDDPAYIDGDYFDNRGGYFTITADLSLAYEFGEASLSSSFALSVESQRIKSAAADLNSAFSVAAEGGFIELFDLSMVGRAELLAEGTVIRGNTVALQSSISTVTEATRFAGPGPIAIPVNSTMSANGGYRITDSFDLNISSAVGNTNFVRIRDTGSEMTAFYSTTSALGALLSDTANLVSAFTVGADLSIIHSGSADLYSTGTLTGTGALIRSTESNLAVEHSVAATGLRILQIASDLQGEFNIGAELPGGGFDNNVDTQVTFEGAADLTGVFAPEVTANLTRTTDTDLQCAFDLTAQGVRTRTTDTAIGADFALVAQNSRIRLSASDLGVETNSTATGTVIIEGTAAITGVFAPEVTVSITRTTDINLNSEFGLSVTGNLTRGVRVDLNGAAVLTGSMVGTLSGTVAMPVRFTLSGNGGFFSVSPDRVYQITRENRTVRVELERRTVNITEETRTYSIQGGS